MKIVSFPPLFKIDNNDKLRSWTIEVVGNIYHVAHGVVDGEIQKTSTTITVGKNLGQSNETTPHEQAISEARAKWNKQVDKGYTIHGAVKNLKFRPMLAHVFDESKVSFPVYVQPKLDGIRCCYHSGKLYSRNNKEFTAVPHILKALNEHIKENVIIDGELYCHGMDFQQITSIVKRGSQHKDYDKIQLHVFDVYYPSYPNLSYDARFHDVIKYVEILRKHNQSFKTVWTRSVSSRTELEKLHASYTKEGYEGVIIRIPSGPYEPDKRSHHLLKYKKFITEEFVIVGGYENQGKAAGQCSLVCETKDGKQFSVKPKGTDEERRDYWKNIEELKGKELTVEFFSYTKEGIPRFPIGLAVRDYE